MDLGQARRLLSTDRGLVVISVTRADGTVSTSLVNAGLMDHPRDGSLTLALVAKASAYKCRRLRIDPRATVTVQRGWEWQAVEGQVELIGPHDPVPAGSIDVPDLLRQVFRAAGGTHDDWAEFDTVMAAEARTAILISPTRVYGNATA